MPPRALPVVEVNSAQLEAGRSVSTATSGGQLMRTGTYTVPTPLLTNNAVFSRVA